MTEGQRATLRHTNRTAETVAFLIGVIALGVHMIADSLIHVGWRFGPCEAEPVGGVPWGVVLGSAVLILPKAIGRARAGQILLAGIQAITLRLTGKGAATAVLSTTIDGEESRPVAIATLPEGGGTTAVTMEGDARGLADQRSGVETRAAAEIARAGKAIEGDV